MCCSRPIVTCAPLLALIGGIAAARMRRCTARHRRRRASDALVPEKNPAPRARIPSRVGSVQWNGWGRDLYNTRYQPEPAIRAMDVPKLALKWAFGFQGGTEFGQPTLVDGRLFVRVRQAASMRSTPRRLHLLDL